MLGFFSSVVSYVLMQLWGTVFFMPGIIFGLFLCIHFKLQIKGVNVAQLLLFTLFSGIGYFAAIWTFLFTATFFIHISERIAELFIHFTLLLLNSVAPSIAGTMLFNGMAWYIGTVFSLPTAGMVGSSLLCLGIHLFIVRLSFKVFKICVLVGGILSISYLLHPTARMPIKSIFDNGDNFLSGLFVLLLVWQTGMVVAIGWATMKMIRINKQRK